MQQRPNLAAAALAAPTTGSQPHVGMRLQLAGRGRGSNARLHTPSFSASFSSCGGGVVGDGRLAAAAVNAGGQVFQPALISRA